MILHLFTALGLAAGIVPRIPWAALRLDALVSVAVAAVTLAGSPMAVFSRALGAVPGSVFVGAEWLALGHRET